MPLSVTGFGSQKHFGVLAVRAVAGREGLAFLGAVLGLTDSGALGFAAAGAGADKVSHNWWVGFGLCA